MSILLLQTLQKRAKDLGPQQKKPFSAVTVQIDRLTSEQYEENVGRETSSLNYGIVTNGPGSRRTGRPYRGSSDTGVRSDRGRSRYQKEAVRNVDLIAISTLIWAQQVWKCTPPITLLDHFGRLDPECRLEIPAELRR